MKIDRNGMVTIIVPSYNQGRFLRECLDSCLAQDYRPLEILVIDGGSTDETLAVLRSYKNDELKWWSERDDGVVDAVNKGLAKARGGILTIQSSDDVLLPGALGAAVNALYNTPAAGFAYGDVELIDAKSKLIGADEQGPFDFVAYLGRLQYVPQPGTCFTREAMQATGWWRPEVSYAADGDFWMRMASRFPAVKIDRRLARYRYHDQQRDTQHDRIARDATKAAQDLIDSGVLDARQERYARMGLRLIAHRYSPPNAWLRRSLALYSALLVNPAGIFNDRFPKRELIPWRDPIWSILSVVKRRLGFKARGA